MANVQLAEIDNGRADDATPACLTYDDRHNRVYVGMFQSMRGICVIEPESGTLIQDIRFASNDRNGAFAWADPLSQAVSGDLLLSVNRNNRELVALDRASLQIKKSLFVGEAPNGPRAVLVWGDHAVVSYPGRNGLLFIPLEALR
jgi:hypothetical protein